jgi:hypothetical protein
MLVSWIAAAAKEFISIEPKQNWKITLEVDFTRSRDPSYAASDGWRVG